MTWRDLEGSFAAWSARGEPLVLATVFDTEGSTYSKAGARMLITGDGRFQGMLSGGCLEGDLALRAAAVLDAGEPQSVTYDLRAGDDDVWGLGVGCDGMIRVFLQPLLNGDGYEPFTAMIEVLSGDRPGTAATVIRSSHPALPAGASRVAVAERSWWFRVAPPLQDAWMRVSPGDAGESMRSHAETRELDGQEVTILFSVLEPPPRILVLGAGPDAEPVVRLAGELGWRVTVQDHRPAYIERARFDAAEKVLCVPAGEVGTALDWSRYRAVIVMSHHLETDRTYLAQLSATDIPYIGLLGPRNRRIRLLDELGAASELLKPRLHGPAGLDIGGEGPASIALSILAEMHAALMK